MSRAINSHPPGTIEDGREIVELQIEAESTPPTIVELQIEAESILT